MAQRMVLVPGVGEVLVSKRRGAKHLRLSVSSEGRIRVSMPVWAPYSSGAHFAASRKKWIMQQLATRQRALITNGSRIGKLHRVVFVAGGQLDTKIRLKDNIIEVKTSQPSANPRLQEQLIAACEKTLKKESNQLFPSRLAQLAAEQGYAYRQLRVRKLVSRWGSCSKDGTVTLNYYLVQLPWELIDYVMLHELVHTKHLHHGAAFWGALERALPEAKNLKKQIRQHNPGIQPH